jgi:hypothetical protein
MTDWNFVQIPPPSDWQAFERLCHRLWMRLWNDPNAQLNGRTGQEQHGVDIFGQTQGKLRWGGIQCKRRDGRFGYSAQQMWAHWQANDVALAPRIPPHGAWRLSGIFFGTRSSLLAPVRPLPIRSMCDVTGHRSHSFRVHVLSTASSLCDVHRKPLGAQQRNRHRNPDFPRLGYGHR